MLFVLLQLMAVSCQMMTLVRIHPGSWHHHREVNTVVNHNHTLWVTLCTIVIQITLYLSACVVIYKKSEFRCFLAVDRPNLYQLQKIEGQGGRTVKLIEQVAPFWDQLACSLHFRPAVIQAIDRDHRKCERACMDMSTRWLEGSARQPVTWKTLIAALRDSGQCNLEKLATVLDAALLDSKQHIYSVKV